MLLWARNAATKVIPPRISHQHSWTYWQNASGLGYDAYGQPKVFETPGWCGSGTWQTVLSVYFWQNGQWQYYPSLYDYKGSTSTGC